MFERDHLQLVMKRLREPRKFIQVIMGPRQVGKTTMINQLTQKIKIDHLYVSADGVGVGNAVWLQQQWEAVRIKIKQSSIAEFVLIIDEIQKIHNWSETVKMLWDTDTMNKSNLKVILLGSSRLLMQVGLTESLAGRFEVIHMGHWNYTEMNEAFGWNSTQYAWFGGYPGAAELINEEKRWKAYVQHSIIETSISKDILMLTRIDKPALMKRLFELGCFYSGQVLSFTKIMGQLADAGNTTTLLHYLNLLDTAGLLAGLGKYSKNVIRKRSSSPKFQVHNTALISSQIADSFEEIMRKRDHWGRVVESSIGAHLINYSLTGDFELFYWRERNDEVDFVIERGDKTIGLEVKTGATKSTEGISAFKSYANPEKVLLVGDSGIPWEEFLKINPLELF